MKKVVYALTLSIFFVTTAFVNPSTNEVSVVAEDLDVKFRVQICAYENHVPYNKVETMRKLGKVMVIKKDGWAYYYSKEYATEAQATSQLQYYIGAGFEEAVEVAEINNEFYSLEDYHKILEEKKKDKDKEPTIHIYK